MNIADQIMRRADRAFAEASGRTLIEDLSPMERKAIEDDMERKARYVRTPAGVRRFKRPIGAIILPRGGSLDQIRIKDPVFKGFDLVEDRKGNLYDIGRDPASGGKYVVLKHNTWDDQVEPQDSLDKALSALNEKLGGGTNSDEEKPAPKDKKPSGPKKTPDQTPVSDQEMKRIERQKRMDEYRKDPFGDTTVPKHPNRLKTPSERQWAQIDDLSDDEFESFLDLHYTNGDSFSATMKDIKKGRERDAGKESSSDSKPQGDAPASDDNVASSDPRKRSAKFKRAADNMDRALDAVDNAKTEDDYRRALVDLEKSTVEMEDYIKSKGSEEDFARSALPKIERAKAKARSQIKRMEAKRKDQAGAGARDKSKAVTRDTPIGTQVRVSGEGHGNAGATGQIVRRNKNGVTIKGKDGTFSAPYDALETTSKADGKRIEAAQGASKDLDLLDRQASGLQKTMDRMEKASTLDELNELDRDFTVQRARQRVKADEIIKNPRTSDEDRKRAQDAKDRVSKLDDDEIALLERKKKELSAPKKVKPTSIGTQGSKERDAFIESHPKIKDVTDYHKPKLRDMSEKNFEAYVAAVEGGKSPNSVGPIMDRIDAGASWNPTTEKWVGQNSTKRPTSPTPTGDTSASDAADAAVRDRVEKMKASDRSKGRTNPYTSSLKPHQKDEVDALTPGEYATYMNARDDGHGHQGAVHRAKNQPKVTYFGALRDADDAITNAKKNLSPKQTPEEQEYELKNRQKRLQEANAELGRHRAALPQKLDKMTSEQKAQEKEILAKYQAIDDAENAILRKRRAVMKRREDLAGQQASDAAQNQKNREARESAEQDSRFGNTATFVSANQDLIKKIVSLGRSGKDPYPHISEARARLAEIDKRLSWADDELGGYHKGKGKAESDERAAQFRESLQSQRTNYEKAINLMEDLKAKRSKPKGGDKPVGDQHQDMGEIERIGREAREKARKEREDRERQRAEDRETMRQHERANFERAPFRKAWNAFKANEKRLREKDEPERVRNNRLKAMEESIKEREMRLATERYSGNLFERDRTSYQASIDRDKKTLEEVRALVAAKPKDKPLEDYVPPSQRDKPSSSGARASKQYGDAPLAADGLPVQTSKSSGSRATGDYIPALPKGNQKTYVITSPDGRTHLDNTSRAATHAVVVRESDGSWSLYSVNGSESAARKAALTYSNRNGVGSAQVVPSTPRESAQQSQGASSGAPKSPAYERGARLMDTSHVRQRSDGKWNVMPGALPSDLTNLSDEDLRFLEGGGMTDDYKQTFVLGIDDSNRLSAERRRRGRAAMEARESEERATQAAEIQRQNGNVTWNPDLTPAQKGRLDKHLAREYRYEDGIHTTREEYGKTTGKRITAGEHFLVYEDGSSVKVPKIVYDAAQFPDAKGSSSGASEALKSEAGEYKTKARDLAKRIREALSDTTSQDEAYRDRLRALDAEYTALLPRNRQIQDAHFGSDRATQDELRGVANAAQEMGAERNRLATRLNGVSIALKRQQSRRPQAKRPETTPSRPRETSSPAPAQERVKGVDSTVSLAKTQAQKARRARTEKAARDHINTLNSTERDLNRNLERSGDRMPADQRAEVEQVLQEIRAARVKAEQNIPLRDRTHLRPADLPALREEAESRRYTIANPRVNAAVDLFNEIPSGTDLPNGRRYEQSVDMDDVYAMDNPPSVPELNRAIDALEKEGDGDYDDEMWVLRTVRDNMKERIDRERAETEAANTSLFGDDLSIPESRPAGQSEDRTNKTAISIGNFGVRSETEARQMYANTPRRDIADIPKGGNGHIGNGIWVKRCPVCGQAFKSVGAPGYSATYARHVDGHNTGAAIPGYNTGMMS